MGGGRLENRCRRRVAKGRRQSRRRVVDVRVRGHSRPEGFPIAIPENTIGLGNISTEPEERRLSLTKGKA